jgi:flavin-dependent dehydrogenase
LAAKISSQLDPKSGRQQIAMQIHGTSSIDDFQDGDMLDVIVIGAGPAGSASAVQLARLGYSVLLVDKQRFPRDKVCGSCLSGKAIASLHHLGLERSLDRSIPLTEFVLATAGRQVRLTCAGGRAVSRRTFDTRLVMLAIEAGARFLPGVRASAGLMRTEHLEVRLSSSGQVRHLRTQVALICCGLGKGVSAEWGLSERVSPRSRIGLTAYLRQESAYQPGSIYMCVDRSGYLGLTVLEDGRLNLSACVDRKILGSSTPTEVATGLIRRAGLVPPRLSSGQRWMGTPSLTRQLTCPAGHRFFVVGDAAGYVEPFTGEGIAWALEGAREAKAMAEQAIAGWDDSLVERWRQNSRRRQCKQQRTCNVMKLFARRPAAVTSAVAVLRHFPALASPVIRAIHNP